LKFQVGVFWVVTPPSSIAAYQHLRGTASIFSLNMEAVPLKTLISYHKNRRRHDAEELDLEQQLVKASKLAYFDLLSAQNNAHAPVNSSTTGGTVCNIFWSNELKQYGHEKEKFQHTC